MSYSKICKKCIGNFFNFLILSNPMPLPPPFIMICHPNTSTFNDWMTIIAASLVICFSFLFAHLPNFQSESAFLPANLTANLPTRLCDYLITCQPADLPSCLLGIMPNCLLSYLYSSLHVNLQIHLPAYLHTCQPTYLLTFPPTCLPNCLHTCLTGPA